MLAYALILVKTFVNLFESIFIKKYSQKTRNGRVLFLTILGFISALVFVLTDRDGITLIPAMLPYGLSAAFFYCSASLLTFIAFQTGSFALTNLLLSYSLVMSIVYGLFFLKEELSVWGYVGIVLMLISIFLVRASKTKEKTTAPGLKEKTKATGLKEKDRESEKVPTGGENVGVSMKWVICVTLSVLGSGLYGVVTKMQQVRFQQAYDNEFALLAIGGSSIAMLIISLCTEREEWKRFFRKEKLYAVGAGVSNGLTNLLGLIVTAMIPISILSPASAGIKIIFSFLVSKFVFHEKFTLRQIFGVIVGGASLILLKL